MSQEEQIALQRVFVAPLGQLKLSEDMTGDQGCAAVVGLGSGKTKK